ncbi:MAG TPA: tetratricopeptide repeat protein [Candidatus Obscuribacterales bacterium]
MSDSLSGATPNKLDNRVIVRTILWIGLGLAAGLFAVSHPCRQAQQLESGGNYKGAIDVYTAALANPIFAIDPTIYYERAYCKRMARDFYGAIKDLSDALKLRRDYWYLWGFKGIGVRHYLDYTFNLELGKTYFDMGDFSKSVESFTKALGVEKTVEAYQGRSSAFEKEKKNSEAEQDLLAAVESSKPGADREKALHLRALFYWRLGRRDEALRDLTEAVGQHTCREAFTDKGFIEFEKGMYKESVADFSKSIDISPSERAYHGRALAQSNLGDYDSAESDIARAVELDPACASVKADQQRILQKSKNKGNND